MNPVQRAKQYDEQRKARLSKSGFTRSRFGDVGRNVDEESDKPKLREHSFVKQPKPIEEQRAEKSEDVRDEMREIEQDEEKETDKKDFTQKEAPPKVRSPPVTTKEEMIAKHETGGAFTKAWTVADHVTIPEVIHSRKSSFLPNFIAATIIIEAMEHCLDGVEELKWIAPFYFSLPARIYWSVLFYIQILKAKEAAGKLTRPEGTWYRAFKRVYPLESLPVAGPLVPFYTNIRSAKPDDDMYDLVYPDFETNLGLTIEKGKSAVRPSYRIQPNIHLLTAFLRRFTRLTLANLDETIAAGGARYFNDEGAFIPNRIGEDFTFGGINYPAALDVATSATFASVGMDKPIPENKRRLKDILGHWKRSKVAGIPDSNAEMPFATIGDALRMPEDFEWFEDCIEMATIQCKFFTDSINMSQIPATGGTEVLISAHITGKADEFPDDRDWFPENWRNLKAQFRTTRADMEYEQTFQAAYALSTATISWDANGHPIGGRQIGHRTGPYWDNRLFQYEQSSDIEVMRRVLTMIRSLFFDAHGKASD